MSEFKVKCPPVSDAEALRCADELERMVGEIMNGKRKASQLPAEAVMTLIQFARDSAKNTKDARRWRGLLNHFWNLKMTFNKSPNTIREMKFTLRDSTLSSAMARAECSRVMDEFLDAIKEAK